ncbi:MAG: hypothetical protein AABZ45_06200 [Pseudomonadota bacterium]
MIHWSKTLIGFAVGTASALMPSGTKARVISNVAQANWDSSTGQRSVSSNQVDIAVDSVPTPIQTMIYAINPPGSGQQSQIDSSGCRVTGQGTSGVFQPPPSSPGALISLTPANEFTAGQPVAFGISSVADNLSATTRDTIEVTIRTALGDEERLTLLEDAVNSGFFVGYLPTVRMPPALVQGDCRLSVAAGSPIRLSLYRQGVPDPLASAIVSFLVDPFGVVFDSGDGSPVAGARVTLINDATGLPAQVFGDDGVSAYPSAVVTGSTITDSGGQSYIFPVGDYRFPFVAPGIYRVVVQPPDPYRWPSTVSIADLASFRRSDNGAPYTLGTFSYGAAFQLVTPAPVRVDIPVDRPNAALSVTKIASTAEAVPGQAVQYRIEVRNGDARRATGAITLTDDLPRAVHLRATTMRYNGQPLVPIVTSDGRQFTVTLPALAPATSGILTYLADIRPDSAPGDAINLAIARDNRGSVSNTGEANIRIHRDTLGDRMTIIGRVTNGGCAVNPDTAIGIGGVRVMMQDGSFAITDGDGRYHFEGVRPGMHVVQIDPSSLPPAHVALDCARNSRSAGSAISRFVDGHGGDLRRADFHAAPVTSEEVPADAAPETIERVQAPDRPLVADDVAVAGGATDFFAGQSAGIDWVFPAPEYNPRNPSTRIAIKLLTGQSVQLSLDGVAVNPLNFDGSETSGDGSFKISVWRGVEIHEGANRFTARVTNADGSVAAELERTVNLSGGPLAVAMVPELSMPIADGLNRPVIAVRLTDRNGRPIRQGVVGDFAVEPPHRAALDVDTEQDRQLSGLDRGRTTWRVEGDDGIAYIELQPTTASGTARLSFTFRDDEVVRQQQLDIWLNPGNRPWTVVGFAAGTVGYNTLDDRMEPVAETLATDNVDGRIALYAKGRISGQWLMTLAYDSDHETDEARFGGVIDPRAYYTIYADRADHGFDAASVRNLYLRLERPQFYALFGDFDTGINEPELARYQRAMNGAKAEYRGPQIAATAFVADTPYRHRRDELQGNGLSGPYQLGARDVLANSERVIVETRDRLRSDIVVSSRTLSRHIDYDIDYFAGTLRFREPILSRDSGLNPQFIIADYEVAGVGQRVLNAGGRASWSSDNGAVRIGGTFIHDESDVVRTNLGGVDVRFRPDASTEIRAEFAMSDSNSASAAGTSRAYGWLIEAEHHGRNFDMLAYARERRAGFGVGQLSTAGESSRRVGFDGKLRLSHGLSLLASAWQEDYLARNARRHAARMLAEWQSQNSTLRAGLTYAEDHLSTGERNRSTIAQFGGAQRLFNQRLELTAQTEFALGGQNDSVDFPARHSIGARLNVSPTVALVANHEITSGGTVDARTTRIGFDIQPWAGARANLSGANQHLGEFGPRSFAAYGLTQSLAINEHVTVDATLDGQRTLGGIRVADVLDPAHPVASGGFLDGSGSLTEDFMAMTAGATYRTEDWSIALRGEYRDGEIVNRTGFTLGGIRRIGDGRAFGGLFSWTRATSSIAASTETMAAELSWAHRPSNSRWSALDKLEFRLDDVRGAVAGQPGPIGGPALTVSGDVRSRRVVNSLAVNFTPLRQSDGLWREAGEYSLFWGVRYASDRFGADDVAGWSTVVGGDIRFDLREMVGVGVSANARVGTNARTTAWSVGPQVVISPMDNANIIIGYNFGGFSDRDFEANRYSRSGIYATFRLKFDQTSLSRLGL